MTTPAAPPRNPLLLFKLAAMLLAYVVAWHVLWTTEPPVPLLALLLGLLLLPVTGCLPRFKMLAGLAVIALVFLFGSESFEDGFAVGLSLACVLVLSAVVAWAVLQGFRDGLAQRDAPAGARIIGLSGYHRSGKDTAAEALLADGWHRVAVSDKIMQLALAIDPPIFLGFESTRLSTLADERGWTATKEIPQVLELLQGLGVAVRDVLDPDAFVKATWADLPEGDLVFTSVRFPNEAQAIKNEGGFILRVERPLVGPANDAITDTAMDNWPFDAYLVNDSTPEVLHQRIRETVDRLYDTSKA